ncbi:MAG TPA: DUF502 domain-containing protein [Parasegetibacter sp.]
MSEKKLSDGGWHWRKIFQYFLQGMIILAPIIITIWAVVSLFTFVDNILPEFLISVGLYDPADKEALNIPGLGFLLVLLIVIVVGYFSSFFMVGRMVHIFDKILERTPGIKFIYGSLKDFFEAFAGDKKKFNRPVLVSLEGNNVWQVAFITQSEGNLYDLPDHVAVYIPFSYSIAGKVYWVPADRVRMLDNVSASDAMKFAISGGVTQLEEEPETQSQGTRGSKS